MGVFSEPTRSLAGNRPDLGAQRLPPTSGASRTMGVKTFQKHRYKLDRRGQPGQQLKPSKVACATERGLELGARLAEAASDEPGAKH